MLSRKRSLVIESGVIAGGAVLLGTLVTALGLWSIPVVVMVLIGLAALYRPAWALTVLVFLLPFTAIEGTATGADLVIHDFKKLAAFGVAVAWLIHVFLRRRPIDVPRGIVIPVLMLAVAAFASALRAPAPVVAFTSTIRMLVYALVYLIIVVDLVREPKDLWRLLRLQFVSAVITGLFGVYQFAAHFAGWRTYLNPVYETVYVLPRIHSFMQEPLWLSNYLLSILPVACTLFCWRFGRWPLLSGLTAGLAAVSVILAASRLGWFCAALTLVMFLITAVKYTRRSRLSLMAVAGTVGLIVVGSMWTRSFGSAAEMGRYVKDFATFSGAEGGEGDLQGHLRMLPLIADGIQTSSVIGIGTNNVGFRFYDTMGLEEPRISSTHNTYLDAFLETGGLGVLSFVILIVVTLRTAWKGFRYYRGATEGAVFLGLGLGVLALAFHLTNWSGWREAHVWYALGLTIAASRVFSQPRRSGRVLIGSADDAPLDSSQSLPPIRVAS